VGGVGPLTSSSRAPWVKYFSSLWSFSNESGERPKRRKISKKSTEQAEENYRQQNLARGIGVRPLTSLP
jgi:hypothetical protein